MVAEAIRDGAKAIEMDPNIPDGYLVHGIALMENGDPDGAIADFTKAIERNPRVVDAWRNRAIAKMRKGDREGAAADLRSALEAVPPGSPAAEALRRELEGLKR